MTASSGEVKIWEVETGRELHRMYGHEPGKDIGSSIWSNNGKYVATTSNDQTIKIWDAKDGSLVADLRGHQSSVEYLQFSTDDSRILTVGVNAKLWDVESGREVLWVNGAEQDIVGLNIPMHRVVAMGIRQRIRDLGHQQQHFANLKLLIACL